MCKENSTIQFIKEHLNNLGFELVSYKPVSFSKYTNTSFNFPIDAPDNKIFIGTVSANLSVGDSIDKSSLVILNNLIEPSKTDVKHYHNGLSFSDSGIKMFPFQHFDAIFTQAIVSVGSTPNAVPSFSFVGYECKIIK